MSTDRIPTVVSKFYHTETFQYLTHTGDVEIRRRLHDVPQLFRIQHLSPMLSANEWLAGDIAWSPLRAYLDAIEAHIAIRIGQHSPAYWLHLYRRIAPILSPLHEGKRDAATLLLVRQAAELAYLKHGNLLETSDIGSIDKARLHTLLDGHYYPVAAECLGGKLKAQKEFKTFRDTHQSVMLNFKVEDLYFAYEVEGFAYEYWRTSACMRRVGKGTSIRWNLRTNWVMYDDATPPVELFEIHDMRTEHETGIVTQLGTWGDPTKKSDGNSIFVAQYNPYPETEVFPPEEFARQVGLRYRSSFNFALGATSFSEFAARHAFMAKPFEARHSVRLIVVLGCIWAISLMAELPDRVLFAKQHDLRRTLLDHLVNLRFRGYTLFRYTRQELVERIDENIRMFQHDLVCSIEEICHGLDFITLTEPAQSMIGLWSGGKRPLVISCIPSFRHGKSRPELACG